MIGLVGWVRWTAGAEDEGPEDVSLETLDQFLRRYHLKGWVRMANGEVHEVLREEVEPCELPDDVLADCKQFVEANVAFNEDMWKRAQFGDDYKQKEDEQDAYDLEREKYRRSGERDAVAEKARADFEAANPLPPGMDKSYFERFEPGYDAAAAGDLPDHLLPGRPRLDHSKHDDTWHPKRDVDLKADFLTGKRRGVQYH